MPAKHSKVTVFPDERDALPRVVSTGKAAAFKRRRAQILFQADPSPQGPAWPAEQIGVACAVGQRTGARTRKAFG
jgi:hypothetical protein